MNPAGELRAEAEAVYALSRSFRTAECLDQSVSLLRRLSSGRYPWVRIQALLARSTCLERLGELSSSSALEKEARDLADSDDYKILLLRAMGLTAASDTAVGDLATARAADHAGLEYFWSGSFPPLRAYQFYADHANIAEQAQHWNTAYFLEKEALPMIAMTGNKTTEAMARYRVAMYAGVLGRSQESEEQRRQANQTLTGRQERHGDAALRAENSILMGNFYLQNGQPALATEVLNTVGDEDVGSSFRLQLALHAARGDAAVRQKHLAESREEFFKTYAVSETALLSVRSPRDRALWETQVGPSYRQLVRIVLEEEKDPLLALAIWEKYRSTAAGAVADRGEPAALMRRFSERLRRTSVLTFVQLDDQVAGWLFDDRGIAPFRSPLPATEAARLCGAFRQQAARADSDLSQLRASAQNIFSALLGPVERQLEAGRALAIEPDGACSGIPFEALVDSNGSYLIDRFPVITSPGAFAAGQWSSERQRIDPALRAVIVGDPRIRGDFGETYPELTAARTEAEDIGKIFATHALLTGAAATVPAVQRELGGAQVFHFAGHGAANSDNGMLLLSAPDSGSGGAILDAAALENIAGNLHLAVLSACYSGVGEKLGPFNPDSLIQALWRAGVPNVIATRWAVDSGATRKVMGMFYQQLLRGETPGAALRAAVSNLRAEPEFAHPAMWAAFHVFGSPLTPDQEKRR